MTKKETHVASLWVFRRHAPGLIFNLPFSARRWPLAPRVSVRHLATSRTSAYPSASHTRLVQWLRAPPPPQAPQCTAYPLVTSWKWAPKYCWDYTIKWGKGATMPTAGKRAFLSFPPEKEDIENEQRCCPNHIKNKFPFFPCSKFFWSHSSILSNLK